MPPRASVTRKKSGPEVQYDELQRALLERVAAQPFAEQPSAQQQPSATQQQPSARQQGFAQPSHSPVLPLVLPTPSIHSTSGSTASTTINRAGINYRKTENQTEKNRTESIQEPNFGFHFNSGTEFRVPDRFRFGNSI